MRMRKSVDGAIQRAVHHQRLMRLAVFADVSSSKRRGRVKSNCTVESCHGRADGIHQLDVDLRPVERGFVGHHFHFDVETLGGVLERVFGDLPLLGAAVDLPLAPLSQVESSASYLSKRKW